MSQSPPTIGLIGPLTDPSLQRVSTALGERGARVETLDLRSFPEDLLLAVDEEGLRANGLAIDRLDALFVRQGEYMSPVPEWVPEPEAWAGLRQSFHQALRARQEARSVRASVLMLLSERRPVVNPASVHRARRLLPSLLRGFEEAGLPVAPFVSGNDLEELAYFVDAAGQRCRARRLMQDPWEEQTADFSYLKEHHLDLDRHPLLLRRWMGGSPRLALVIGGTCCTVASRTEQGWQPVTPLGAEARAAACSAAKVAGAAVAGVQLELDGDGRPWLLGLDPEPDLAAIEEATGQDLAAPVAELLLELAGRGRERQQQPRPTARPVEGSLRVAGQAHSPPSRPRRSQVQGLAAIGLAGRQGDLEVAALAQALRERGAHPVLLELPLFPLRRAIHESSGRGRMGQEELAGLDALFLRITGYSSPLPPEDGPLPGPEAWQAIYPRFRVLPADQGECFQFKYALMETLSRRIPVINPPAAQEVHRTKVWQIASLHAAGLPVPPTFAGNDPDAARSFVASQGGPDLVVVKPLAGVYKTCLLSDLGIEQALAWGPIILQRYIKGETIRTYIVGGELVGAARILHSDASVDSSIEQSGVERVELPEEVWKAGWAAAQHLGLSWTGMDFQRDEQSGEHWILECNASAMFATFSRLTGCDVPGALADLLCGLAISNRQCAGSCIDP